MIKNEFSGLISGMKIAGIHLSRQLFLVIVTFTFKINKIRLLIHSVQ